MRKSTGVITPAKNKRLCKLYEQIHDFVQQLDRLPDAQEVQGNKLRSVPKECLPMVF